MAETQTQTPMRQAPGGTSTVMLGDDSISWQSTSIACRGNAEAAQAVSQLSQGPRVPPGGADSVAFGASTVSATVEELLARPSPGGHDSVASQADPSMQVAATLPTRLAPGGVDSIDFGKQDDVVSAADLLSRPTPGGKATVVFGGDTAEWSTTSQVHGLGSTEACAAMEPQSRAAPGGTDSIDFGAAVENPSTQVLLARSSPGGCDSVDFGASVVSGLSAQELWARPQPGGPSTMVLGGDNVEWIRDSQIMGAGSAEAVAAMEPTPRPAPGGVDSVDFNARPAAVSKEHLLARPAVGGQDAIVLGGDQATWETVSGGLGTGCADIVGLAAPCVRPPPGGSDSINSILDAVTPTPLEELLSRPAAGGKASIVLGSDASDWVSSSNTHGIPSGYVAESVPRQNIGGVDSVDFGATQTLPTVESLLARPATGGVDSIEFGKKEVCSLTVEDLLARASPGGEDKVLLGSSAQDWTTSSQEHKTLGADHMGSVGMVRPPPGGVDSIAMAINSSDTPPSVEDLLARSAVGGTASLVLGTDVLEWSPCSSVLGDGCIEAASNSVTKTARTAVGAKDSVNLANDGPYTPVKPMRIMNATAAASQLTLEDHGFTPQPGVSSNRFASGSNPNAGNVLTDRPTTRLHQAPGGNSSICLGDESFTPAVGVARTRELKAPEVPRQNIGGVDSIEFGKKEVCSLTVEDLLARPSPGGDDKVLLGSNAQNWTTTSQEHKSLTAEHTRSGGTVSSNRYASGSNPNAGNVLTDRPTTRLHQAPGGNSSICLGDGSATAAVGVERRREATGNTAVVCSSENIEKKSTETLQDENLNSANLQQALGDVVKIKQAPGGNASLVLG